MFKFVMKCDCGAEAKCEVHNFEQDGKIRVDEYLTGSTFKCEKCGKKYYTADWRECFALPMEEI